MHTTPHLIHIFNQLFQQSENTILIGGSREPLYIPAGEHPHHRIFFREDYFASALHEVAHWCLAGKKRRQLEDYGYWYKPDGRDPFWQARFEEVEVRPQALECIFSAALDFPFQVSVDNLINPGFDNHQFARKVQEQVTLYLDKGLPSRAALFLKNLMKAPQTLPLPSALPSDSW